MKKALSLILALIMCLSLCACGDADASRTENGDSAVSDATQPTEHVMTEAEIFAAKILTCGVKCFENPLSVKVKNVWASSIGDKYYHFTYELEVKNSAGIMESVYYGNMISFSDLTDKTLEDALSEIRTNNTMIALGGYGSSMYFRENQIEAMQEGEALDAASIQQYFLKNYD